MINFDFAKRAYDHSFKIDPIIRFLSDTDFYKLLMHQFIYRNFYNTTVSFQVFNRSDSVLLATEIDEAELRAQLDHVRTLKWEQNELNYLKAQEFYGKRDLFCNAYLDYLQHSFKLSDYDLEMTANGQILLTFKGTWVEVTLWEIYALAIINEMRYRRKMALMTKMGLDVMYSQAKTKAYRKAKKLARLANLKITDFGTRRRHSHLWQEYIILLYRDILGDRFIGTSNVYFAMKHGLNAIGTNAHEMPMAYAAMAAAHGGSDEEIREAQYKFLRDWAADYRGGLQVFLPDTFGTTQFLKGAPLWLKEWRGGRPDSKKPIPGGEELIAYWKEHDEAIEEKLIVFADGLDVRIDGFEPNGEDITAIYEHFEPTGVGHTYGLGTMGTCDFLGCHPDDTDDVQIMKPISLVCKLSEVEDVPAVKLSDNYKKATSASPEEVARYRAIFGHEGMENIPVQV
jgi:nicotinate phosphoribosyltransferase